MHVLQHPVTVTRGTIQGQLGSVHSRLLGGHAPLESLLASVAQIKTNHDVQIVRHLIIGADERSLYFINRVELPERNLTQVVREHGLQLRIEELPKLRLRPTFSTDEIDSRAHLRMFHPQEALLQILC